MITNNGLGAIVVAIAQHNDGIIDDEDLSIEIEMAKKGMGIEGSLVSQYAQMETALQEVAEDIEEILGAAVRAVALGRSTGWLIRQLEG